MVTETKQQPIATLDDLLAGGTELPVLPEIALRIFDEMRSPMVTAAKMAEFVKKDPVLASSVLRIANSALYGGRDKISDLAFSIARVGLNQIRNLLLAMVLRSKMVDPLVYGEEGPQLMDHCLSVAFGAGVVSEAATVEGSEAFMCGLLHDFGKLALIKAFRERSGGVPLNEDETRFVKEWHAEAGAKLAKTWDLPEIVITVAEHHHNPSLAPDEDQPMVAVVSFANALSHKLGLGAEADDEINLIDHPANEILGLAETRVEDMSGYLPGLFKTARSALFG